MAGNNEKWRRFELLLANFQAIGKSQSFFVNTLVAFLCLVWSLDVLHHSGGVTVQLLGATIQIHGLWPIVPLIASVLCLGLIGSINLIHHAWRRLDLWIPEVFSDPSFFFTEFDPHKNILDYLACLKLSLRKPVLPDTADNPSAEKQKWNPTLLLYPGLVLLSIYTTSFSLKRIDVTWWSVAYAAFFAGIQSLFALPFLWRKACLFVGVHKSAYDGVDWGIESYYRMSLEALERMVKKQQNPGGLG